MILLSPRDFRLEIHRREQKRCRLDRTRLWILFPASSRLTIISTLVYAGIPWPGLSDRRFGDSYKFYFQIHILIIFCEITPVSTTVTQTYHRNQLFARSIVTIFIILDTFVGL